MLISNRKVSIYGLCICVIGALFYAYEFLLRIIPGALQNELMNFWGAFSAGTFGQVAALYYWAYSPMQLPVGMLMDRYGPRCVLTMACLLCAMGMLMFTFSSLLFWVGLGRFLVGLGSSFGFVGMLFLGHHWLPRRYFSLLIGLATSFAMLIIIFGIVKMTAWVSQVGVLCILSVLTWFGFILALLLYAIVRDVPEGIQVLHRQSLAPFFLEVWQILRSRVVWGIGCIGAMMYTSLSVFGELWGKTYLEQVHHLTAMQSAKAVAMVFLGWAIGAPCIGYLSDHFRSRVIPLLIGSCGAFICIMLVLYGQSLSFFMLLILLFGYGLLTASEIIVFAMAKEMCEARLAGTVFATVNMIIMLWGAVLQPLTGHVLDWYASFDVTTQRYMHTATDYRLALSCLPVALFIVMLWLGCYYGLKTAKSSVA